MVELSLNELDAWLQNQPENTDDTPYKIKITEDLGDDIENVKTVANILKNNSTSQTIKYVTLEITATGLLSLTGFASCANLVSINIPNDVSVIGSSAFVDCNHLKSIIIPNNITSIEDYAFSGCRNLENITIPNSVVNIGENAFKYCYGFTEISIPNSVISTGRKIFESCVFLRTVTIATDNIPLEAFYNCTNLTTVNICYGVTTIGSHSFYHCTSLKNITIPESVASIERGAFMYCTSLENITIPESVTSIGDSTFYGCTSLTTVNNISSGITSLNSVFKNCTSLTTINDWKLTDLSNVDMTDCFSGCTALTNIYVPRIIETANTWKVVKLQGSANSVDYAIYDSSTGTKLAYGTIPIGDYGYVDLYEYTDEILFDAKDAITEAKIQEFIQYKVKFGTNGLDPSKKNFVFWADDPDAFVTNMDLGGSTAEEAEKLKTARTINGTNFDGTANITTSKWGTARTIAIKDKNGTSGTATSVDGSGNVTLTLPTTLLTTSDIWIE